MLKICLSIALAGLAIGRTCAAEDLLVPSIASEWTRLTANPDLGGLTDAKQRPADFTVWQAADGTWQLMSCIRATKEAGKTRLLFRWESPALLAPDWQPKGIALRADPKLGETEGGLQAPHVVRDGDVFHLLYGDWTRICMANSTDGKTFQRGAEPALFIEGPDDNARDPFLTRIGGAWRVYYTANPGQTGAVYSRASTDLKTWSPAKMVAQGGVAGAGAYSAECPQVVEAAPGHYYLFRTQRYGANAATSVYHSTDPDDFGIAGKNGDAMHFVTTLPVAAPEIIQDKGQWLIIALRPDLLGHQLARLAWNPLPAAAPNIRRGDSAKIRVALYDDSGSAGKGVPSCETQLKAVQGMEVTKLSADGIRAGLSGYDAVIFSGGSGSRQANTIGLCGREQVRRFVESGGGYVGICAGAYLACNGFKWGVGVLNAKTPSPLWERGHADLKIEATPAGRALLDLPAEATVLYHNGPVLIPGLKPDLPAYEPLVFFRSEIAKSPKQEGLQINTPAMARGNYGKGHVLVSSPHPEQTPGMERWIERAVRAVVAAAP